MANQTFKLRFTPNGSGESIDLSAALVSHNAAFGVRLARHSYLKRDGAELEPMGAEQARVTYRLTFVGPDFASRYRQLVAAIRRDPRGVIVDPLAGQFQAACTGISDASRDLRSSKNAVDVTIGFEEDALDVAQQVELLDPPSAAVQRITTKARAVRVAAAPFPHSALTVAAFLNKLQLLVSAMNAAIDGVAILTLAVKLAAAGKAADLAVAALLADPGVVGQVGTKAYGAVTRIVDAYAASIQADQAIARSRPAVIQYTVTGPVSVFTLAARLYGAAMAQQKAAEIMAANRLPDPLWIATGTKLLISQPSA